MNNETRTLVICLAFLLIMSFVGVDRTGNQQPTTIKYTTWDCLDDSTPIFGIGEKGWYTQCADGTEAVKQTYER